MGGNRGKIIAAVFMGLKPPMWGCPGAKREKKEEKFSHP